MNRFSFAATAVLLISLTAISQVHYAVKGDMPDAEGRKVYMMDYGNNSVIDSTEIKNGKFLFEGNYSRDAYVRIYSGREYANCVLDSALIIDFATHNPRVGTSRLNDRYMDFLAVEEAFYDNGKALRDSCISIGMSEMEAGKYYYENYHLIESPKRNNRFFEGVVENQNGLGEALIRSYINFDPSPDEWDSLYSALTPRLKDYELTKRMNSQFEKLRNTLPGKPFVDFSGKTVNGEDVKLSDYVGKGKYILVDFWASWCGPCRREAGEILIPLYEKYKDNENFEILGVAVWDKPKATKEALEEDGYPWPQIIDAGMTPMELYGFDGIPQIMLFNPDGTIADRDLRGLRLIDTVEKAIVF